MTRILDSFRQNLREPGMTYNVGLIAGGSTVNADPAAMTATGKSNIIAATAQANGDLRTLTDEQYQRTRARMQQIVDQHLPNTGAEITFGEGYPSMPETPGN